MNGVRRPEDPAVPGADVPRHVAVSGVSWGTLPHAPEGAWSTMRSGWMSPGAQHSLDKLRSRGDLELLVDLAQVILDGGRADEQLGGDVTVRAALGDEPGDLYLLRVSVRVVSTPRLRGCSPVASSSAAAR